MESMPGSTKTLNSPELQHTWTRHRLNFHKSTTREPRPTAWPSAATLWCLIMGAPALIPGNVCRSTVTMEFVRASLRASIAISILIVTRNSSALRPLYGLGKVSAQNWEHLTSNVRRLMSARWPIIAGTLLRTIENKWLKSVCPCIRRITSLVLAGKVKTRRNPHTRTINLMASTVRVELLSLI